MSKKKSATQQEVEQATEQAFDETQEQQLDPVEVAAETMLGDMMRVVIDLAKALPKSWQELSEKEQDTWLNSVDAQCRTAIGHCVQIIASEGFVRVPVEIGKGSFKGREVKLEVQLINGRQLPEFLEAEQTVGVLVLADPDRFTSSEGRPKADKDQRSLDLGHEYTDGDGDGMQGGDDDGEAQDELYETAVDAVRASGKASISSIQAALQIGYNRAARLVEAMEAAGVVSKPDGKGARTVLDAAGNDA